MFGSHGADVAIRPPGSSGRTPSARSGAACRMAPAMATQEETIPGERSRLRAGDHAPWFRAAALSGSPNYQFDTVAGRHVADAVLRLGRGPGRPPRRSLWSAGTAPCSTTRRACFFGISVDPEDAARAAHRPVTPRHPLLPRSRPRGQRALRRRRRRGPTGRTGSSSIRSCACVGRFAIGAGRAGDRPAARAHRRAPRRTCGRRCCCVPDVLEPELCADLIRRYEADGGTPSGFMREVDGKTVAPGRSRAQAAARLDDRGRRALPGDRRAGCGAG